MYKQKKVFDKYGLAILSEVYQILSKEKIDCWLDFGTLLGAYRDHDFIPHDADLDLGVFEKDAERFERAMQHSKMLKFDHKYVIGKEKQIAQISYQFNGITIIDFCFYSHDKDDNRQIYTYLGSHPEDSTIPFDVVQVKKVISPFEGLENIEFKGVNCQIPVNTNDYLIANYGTNYMTPDPSFDSSEATNVVEYELDELKGYEIQ